MTPTNKTFTFPEYAKEGSYRYDSVEELQQQAAENYAKGFEPLQTLPATWYNSMIGLLTKECEALKQLSDSIYAELKTVIEEKGLELDVTDTGQLLQAIDKISELQIATASTLGGVISSATSWNVKVDSSTGVMTVNTVAASTSQAGIVQLNDTTTSTSTTQAATANAVKKVADLIPGAASTAQAGIVQLNDSITSTSTTQAATANAVFKVLITATKTASTTRAGIVQLNDSITSTSTTQAATANAVCAVETHIAGVQSLLEDNLITSVSLAQQSDGKYKIILTKHDGSTIASEPINILASHAQYLGESELVTANAEGNLTAHTLELS